MLLVNEELPALENEHAVLLGQAFLRGYYAIHDMDNKSIGLVPLRKDTHELHET